MAKLFTPSGNAAVGVADQVPSGCTVAVAITLPCESLTSIVSPGVPVPLNVGVLSLVIPSPLTPLSLVGASTAAGALGAWVSKVKGLTTGLLTRSLTTEVIVVLAL